MSIWDDPSLRVGGDYVKFDNIGDTVSGTVLSVGAHRWDDGTVSPQIILETADGEKTVTAGQVRLKVALAEKRPEVGDHLTIALTNIEKRAGGKTLKHFDVSVGKGASSATTPAPVAQKAASPAADALDGIDPAVLAALQSKLGATTAASTPF